MRTFECSICSATVSFATLSIDDRAIVGINCWSCSCESCVSSPIVTTFPITSVQIMVDASKMLGLIFPGMIDDQGWTAGRSISHSHARGHEESILRSFMIFMRSRERCER